MFQNNNTPTVTCEGDRRGVGGWLYFEGSSFYVETIIRDIVRIGGECDIGCLTGIRCGINEVITMEAERITRNLESWSIPGNGGSERADGDYRRFNNPVAKKLFLRHSLGDSVSRIVWNQVCFFTTWKCENGRYKKES